MSEPERAGGSENPPDPHRSRALRPKYAGILAALVAFSGAVATVAQLIEYVSSGEINILALAVIIVSFVIGVAYLFSVKGVKVSLIGISIALTLFSVAFLAIKLILPLRFPPTLNCDKIASPGGSDTNTGDSPDSPAKQSGGSRLCWLQDKLDA